MVPLTRSFLKGFLKQKKASFLGFLLSFTFFGVLCYFLVQNYVRPYESLLFFLFSSLVLIASAFLYSFIDVWRRIFFLRTFFGLIAHGIACSVLFVFLVVRRVDAFPDPAAWIIFAAIAVVISIIAGIFGHISVKREFFLPLLSKKQQKAPFMQEVLQPFREPAETSGAQGQEAKKPTLFSSLGKDTKKGKKFCVECGSTLENDDLFCPQCGKEAL